MVSRFSCHHQFKLGAVLILAAASSGPEAVEPIKGCNYRLLCECRRHGKVNGLSGKYIIQQCMSDGTSTENPEMVSNIVQAAVDAPERFQCDSLMLQAYCYKRHGCMTEERISSCKRVKGDCPVDCSRGVLSSNIRFSIALAALSTWILAVSSN
eukprot:TRINITY_DN68481_c0_g1_i1.p1 TRINITY_DN68481_c0_g1~~TRINITY_DN68481_c0_g1_i1.p1  ORF type:complete len:154 (-),score=8.68 TRINITY_DN68481_c0_g1_i1:152-613(-)